MIPNTINGIHRGIIIANNDPEGMGRVKVFVPSVNAAIFDKWFSKDGQEQMSFNGLGENINSYLTPDFLEKLHTLLPWSEVAQPIFGMGTAGKYNAPANSAYLDTKSENPCPPGQAPANPVANAAPAPSTTDLNAKGELQSSPNGKVDPGQLNGYLEKEIAKSKLNGYVPRDGAKYGIDGSPKSWANYMTQLAGKESSYNNKTVGDVGKFVGNSNGLFQLSPNDAVNYRLQSSPFTQAQLTNPETNAKAAIAIHEKLVLRDGAIGSNSTTGAARYWGPLRRGWTPSGTAPSASKMVVPPSFVAADCENVPAPPGTAFVDKTENRQNLPAGGENNQLYPINKDYNKSNEKKQETYKLDQDALSRDAANSANERNLNASVQNNNFNIGQQLA